MQLLLPDGTEVWISLQAAGLAPRLCLDLPDSVRVIREKAILRERKPDTPEQPRQGQDAP